MQHKLNLHKIPFNFIKSGVKTIEFRLFDEKRQKIKIGDELIFVSRENGDIIETEVLGFYKAKSFLELAKLVEINKTGRKSENDLVENMEIYYPKEQQKIFGVVGIEFMIK